MNNESNITKCKTCFLLKIRTFTGFYPNKKDRKFVDENGWLWNGKTCGECHRNKQKTNKRTVRALERAINEKL